MLKNILTKIFIIIITLVFTYIIVLLDYKYKSKELFSDEFYLLISISIVLLITFYPMEKLIWKFSSIIMVLGLFLSGLVNVVIGFNLIETINEKFIVYDNLYLIVDNPTFKEDEEFKNYSNFLLIQILTVLFFAYIFYSLVMNIAKKLLSRFKMFNEIKIWMTKNYSFYLNDLTLLLVIFGFLPLFIEIISFDNLSQLTDVKESEVSSFFAQNVLTIFLGFVIPYAYLLNNPPKSKI